MNSGQLAIDVCFEMQEQSSKKEIGDLQRQLQSSEALVDECLRTLQQRDSELEMLRSKVGNYDHSIRY